MLMQSDHFYSLYENMTLEGNTSSRANVDMNISLHNMNLIDWLDLFLKQSKNDSDPGWYVLCDITMSQTIYHCKFPYVYGAH